MSTVLKRFSLVGVAVALLATGCGTGPAKAGSAAIVGGETIDLATLQDRTVKLLKEKPGAQQAWDQGRLKLDEVSRAVLSDEVLHQVVQTAAQRANITIDEKRVYDVVDQEGGPEVLSAQGIHDPSNIHRWVRDVMIMSEVGRRHLRTLQMTIDFVMVKDPKDAREMAKQIAADPAKMAEFVEAAPRNTSGAQQAGTDQKVSVVEYPSLAGAPLWAAKPGTVLAFQLSQEASTSMVALVKERKTVSPAPGEDNTSDVDEKVLSDYGKRISQYLVEDLKIDVNPRYGVWDPIETMVKASTGELAGFMAPAATKNKS